MTPTAAQDYAVRQLGSAYRSIHRCGAYASDWHVIAHDGRQHVGARAATVEEAVREVRAKLDNPGT